ncbi:hypothetical protein CQW23_32569 [Capsicum baccatum]|uniref:Uncharacterized protein n=1 Tax=Capsicum baccatum TaxID=33114 RepID=A0A2G2V4C4_CAPBA|nr:hypothetical protein CQW23_32569 [Capsicum baccatum]
MRAMGWTTNDIIGISPGIGMHKVHLEEDWMPTRGMTPDIEDESDQPGINDAEFSIWKEAKLGRQGPKEAYGKSVPGKNNISQDFGDQQRIEYASIALTCSKKSDMSRKEIISSVSRSTYGAAENVGTAAKPNGIMHEHIRPSTFELPDHALVGPGHEGGVRVGESPTLLGSEHRFSYMDLSNPSLIDLESQGGDSSTSTSANQQILDLNLALAFQEKLSDPRITSMLNWKERHTDREIANFTMMLKENGLDPMIQALL